MKQVIIILLIFVSALLLNFVMPARLISPQLQARSDSTVVVKFGMVGDIMCHSTQFKYAKAGKDSFNFKPVYRMIKKYLEYPDFMIGNLETVMAGDKHPYTGFPIFNTPDQFLDDLAASGFDMMITANNHSRDMGAEGIRRTAGLIEQLGMLRSGTFIHPEERDIARVIELKGMKFSILSYTYSNNGMPVEKGSEHMLARIDTASIRRDIEIARKGDAEVVIVYLHFGDEYQKEPNYYQKKIVKRIQSYGADIILGSHPHVMQPVDYYNSDAANIDTGFVAYSLGNFISNQRWRYSDTGVILYFDIQKNLYTGDIKLLDVRIIPLWVFKGDTVNGREYVILPLVEDVISSLPEFMTEKDIKLMKEGYFDTIEILTGLSEKLQYEKVVFE